MELNTNRPPMRFYLLASFRAALRTSSGTAMMLWPRCSVYVAIDSAMTIRYVWLDPFWLFSLIGSCKTIDMHGGPTDVKAKSESRVKTSMLTVPKCDNRWNQGHPVADVRTRRSARKAANRRRSIR